MHDPLPNIPAKMQDEISYGIFMLTAARLRAFAGKAGVDPAEIGAVLDAFFFIQILRLRHDIFDASDAAPSPNRIDPDRLNPLERRILKEALRSARRVQKRLALDYQA